MYADYFYDTSVIFSNSIITYREPFKICIGHDRRTDVIGIDCIIHINVLTSVPRSACGASESEAWQTDRQTDWQWTKWSLWGTLLLWRQKMHTHMYVINVLLWLTWLLWWFLLSYRAMLSEERWREANQPEVTLTEDEECIPVFGDFLR